MPGSYQIPLLYLLALSLYACRALGTVLLSPFPIDPDEQAHFSYVLHLHQTGRWLPDFDVMRLVELSTLTTWSERPNYLNHPSPYYVASSWLYAAATAAGFAPVAVLRLANVGLSVAAVATTLSIGARALRRLPAHVAFIALVVSVPTLPIIGGMITNDNLALLGGALCCAGLLRLFEGDGRARVWSLLASGFMLASLAKLTAGLLCGTLLATGMVALTARDGMAAIAHRRAALAICAGLLAALPYAVLLLRDGSPAPLTDGQVAVISTRLAEMHGAHEPSLSFPAYALFFAKSLLAFWPPSLPETTAGSVLLLVPMVCLAIAAAGGGAALAAGGRALDPLAVLVLCGAVAIVVTMAIHLEYVYARYLETGWPKGIYPHYYFPLLPVIPAACALAVSQLGSSRAAGCLAGLLIGLTLGAGAAWEAERWL